MDTALWAMQVILALVFGLVGVMKLVVPKEKAAERMGYVNDFTENQLKLIGVAELAAAVGLILPWATGILPILTPLAAVGLVVIMVGAALVHRRRGETPMIISNVVLLLAAAFVAYGRLALVPTA